MLHYHAIALLHYGACAYFFLFFYVLFLIISDMKTRKWNFLLEDFKVLSESELVCDWKTMYATGIWCIVYLCKNVLCICTLTLLFGAVEAMVRIPRVQLGPLPQAVIQAFSSQFDRTCTEPMALPEVDLSGVDSTLRCSLMPFQRDGVR